MPTNLNPLSALKMCKRLLLESLPKLFQLLLLPATLSFALSACGGSDAVGVDSSRLSSSQSPAASTSGGYGYVDAVGKEARFMQLSAIVVDKAGNAYVADGQTVRKISPDGRVTTFAGAPHQAREVSPDRWVYIESVDANGRDARFQEINYIAIDLDGNLYVSESAIEYNGSSFYFVKGAVRKITPDGSVTTLVRGGVPYGVAVDRVGNVYFSDVRKRTIEKISPDGSVAVHAGSPNLSGAADGLGNAASFTGPVGIAMDAADNLYVTDFELPGPVANGLSNQTIRRIAADRRVTTIAGSPGMPGSMDGQGSAARFRNPKGIWVDATGALYVADTDNATIRRISADGSVTITAGVAGQLGFVDQPGASARFQAPVAVAGDNLGNLFVADAGNYTVRRISASGNVTTIAGAPPEQK